MGRSRRRTRSPRRRVADDRRRTRRRWPSRRPSPFLAALVPASAGADLLTAASSSPSPARRRSTYRASPCRPPTSSPRPCRSRSVNRADVAGRDDLGAHKLGVIIVLTGEVLRSIDRRGTRRARRSIETAGLVGRSAILFSTAAVDRRRSGRVDVRHRAARRRRRRRRLRARRSSTTATRSRPRSHRSPAIINRDSSGRPNIVVGLALRMPVARLRLWPVLMHPRPSRRRQSSPSPSTRSRVPRSTARPSRRETGDRISLRRPRVADDRRRHARGSTFQTDSWRSASAGRLVVRSETRAASRG